MKPYPIFLIGLEKRHCIMIGGGHEAEFKVKGLLDCDAVVTVIHPTLTPQLEAWAEAGQFTWLILLYSVLTLTVIRMLPVFISLTGTGMSTEGRLFAGWFGPRGLASIVFAIIVVNAKLPNSGPIVMTAVCTIILSILAHGISANPWAQSFGQRHS